MNLFTLDLVTNKRHPDEVLLDRAKKNLGREMQRYMVCSDAEATERMEAVKVAIANLQYWKIMVGLDHALV